MRSRHSRLVDHELAIRARYPLRVPVAGGLVRMRRERWSLENDDPKRPVRCREGAVWFLNGRERAAFLLLAEYNIDCGVYWDLFHMCADDVRQQNGIMVEGMSVQWGGEFVWPADYGSIVMLILG
jgi:hypothetical protein